MARIGTVTRVLGIAAALAVAAALYVALFASPAEAVMGQYVRILYVHVGSAWTAYLSYAVTAFAAVMYLWRRVELWDHVALASAEVGIVLTSVTLITGMFWARSTQGWWWRWDDLRLTLTLLMWFLYAGYLILRQYTEGERRATLSAVIAVAGVPTMILNHMAVTLFPAFHPQPVVARPEGPAISGAFRAALMMSVVAYTFVYAWLLSARVQLEQIRDAVRSHAAAR
jgi:heme exporter protein C